IGRATMSKARAGRDKSDEKEGPAVHVARADRILERAPVAAFDFDSTLRVFKGRGVDADLSAQFLAMLAGRYNIVVFSNRSRKNPDTEALDAYRDKVRELGGDLSMYASLK